LWILIPRHDLDVENPSHAHFALELLAEFLKEMETKLQTETDFLVRSRLEESQQIFNVSTWIFSIEINILLSSIELILIDVLTSLTRIGTNTLL